MQEAGHYYTVFAVSLAAGLSPADAARNAFFSQLPDEVMELDAIWVQVDRAVAAPVSVTDGVKRGVGSALKSANEVVQGMQRKARGDPSVGWTGVDQQFAEGDWDHWTAVKIRDAVQRGLHCLTGGESAKETRFREQELGRLKQGTAEFGFVLHALGDSFAHRVIGNESRLYGTGLGHGVDFFKLKNPQAPEHIWERPDLYRHYIDKLFKALRGHASGNRLGDNELKKLVSEVVGRKSEEEEIKVLRDFIKPRLGGREKLLITPESHSPEPFAAYRAAQNEGLTLRKAYDIAFDQALRARMYVAQEQ